VSQIHLCSAAAFRRRVIGLCLLFSTPAMAIVFACLVALLELTAEQWTWLFALAAAAGAAVAAPMAVIQRRGLAPVSIYLERREGDAAAIRESEDQAQRLRELHAAFAAVIDLPRRNALLACVGWALPTIGLSLAMRLRFEQWGAFETAVLQMAGITAAFVSGSFLYFVAKRVAEPLRYAIAAEIPDPGERRAAIRPTSLRLKLLVSVTGVAILPVVFAVLLSQMQGSRAVGDFAIRWQHAVLEALTARLEEESLDEAKRAVLAATPGLPAPTEISLLDLAARGRPSAGGALEADSLDHVLEGVRRGLRRGDSSSLRSKLVFAWRRLDEDRVLLAATPASELRAVSSPLWGVFALLLLFSTGIAVCLAYLLSSDVSEATEALRSEAERSEATEALRSEAERMASGDLRRGRVFESEDELGELARSFEGMARALRATVGRVAEAADRVDGTAGEIASISESVAEVTADQVRGIEQAAVSMEAINGQVQGIAESSQALNVSVEESSSSILELGAAGEELNETALVLSSKVDEVSGSIGQMVRSVKQVLENTEALSRASVETSTSMDEMASSMREVDASAEEAARLSHQVVASAESGQVKVRQTIEGMEAIREATETAERVIRNLGGRAKEIGAIVDVIADETNLLALNAAIIAAQAGEHGRAFSVVADEIKDLADRVLASTKEIGGLVRAVQAESSNAIGAIEQGTQSVASGVDLSAEAGVSLEEITRASRESGTRIAGIVSAVREQARAAGHVVDLMERVRDGVDEIRGAAAEQDRGNESVHQGAVGMREVAQQVRGTTEEQARGSGRIRESVEEVREAVERINGALQEQSAACRAAVEFLEEVSSRTRSQR
jgi:methyl-accepting chemotaxis protein